MSHTLKPLPYAVDALAPHISVRTVETHYEKHHRGYVDTLNDALTGADSHKELDELVRTTGGDTFNLAGQVWNHDFYWESLVPGGTAPEAVFADEIARSFGSFDDCKQALAESAGSHFGSGWTWLVLGASGDLEVLSTMNAGNPLAEGSGVPLIAIDVWEHAYYLDYQQDKPAHVEALLDHLIDWRRASLLHRDAMRAVEATAQMT